MSILQIQMQCTIGSPVSLCLILPVFWVLRKNGKVRTGAVYKSLKNCWIKYDINLWSLKFNGCIKIFNPRLVT